MLLEKIVCAVAEDEREAFDAAQRAWRPVRYVDGLIARVGGHVIGGEERAVTIAVWRDPGSRERFVRDVRDAIAEARFAGDTELYDVVSRMPGQRIRLAEALGAGRLLRVSSCRVTAEATSAFVRAQLQVWTTGMASAKGMFGGAFCRAREATDAFLMASAWESDELHQLFAEHHVPQLRERAALDPEGVTEVSEQIALERHWTVIGVG